MVITVTAATTASAETICGKPTRRATERATTTASTTPGTTGAAIEMATTVTMADTAVMETITVAGAEVSCNGHTATATTVATRKATTGIAATITVTVVTV